MKVMKAAIFAVRWNYRGMPKIKGYQLHHLIPESLVKKFGNEFNAAGFNVDEGFNLKYLEEGFHTKHKQYTDRVSEKLQEIINNTGGLTKQDILNVVQDMRTLVGDAYNDWKNLGGPKLNEAFR